MLEGNISCFFCLYTKRIIYNKLALFSTLWWDEDDVNSKP